MTIYPALQAPKNVFCELFEQGIKSSETEPVVETKEFFARVLSDLDGKSESSLGLSFSMRSQGSDGSGDCLRRVNIPSPRTPYILVYQLTPASMRVVRVIHGAMQWPPAPENDSASPRPP